MLDKKFVVDRIGKDSGNVKIMFDPKDSLEERMYKAMVGLQLRADLMPSQKEKEVLAGISYLDEDDDMGDLIEYAETDIPYTESCTNLYGKLEKLVKGTLKMDLLVLDISQEDFYILSVKEILRKMTDKLKKIIEIQVIEPLKENVKKEVQRQLKGPEKNAGDRSELLEAFRKFREAASVEEYRASIDTIVASRDSDLIYQCLRFKMTKDITKQLLTRLIKLEAYLHILQFIMSYDVEDKKLYKKLKDCILSDKNPHKTLCEIQLSQKEKSS